MLMPNQPNAYRTIGIAWAMTIKDNERVSNEFFFPKFYNKYRTLWIAHWDFQFVAKCFCCISSLSFRKGQMRCFGVAILHWPQIAPFGARTILIWLCGPVRAIRTQFIKMHESSFFMWKARKPIWHNQINLAQCLSGVAADERTNQTFINMRVESERT